MKIIAPPVFIFFLLICLSGKSQNQNAFYIEARLHYGLIAAHHKSIRHLVSGHFPMFELSIYKESGKKDWARIYNHPFTGFTYLYASLANNKYLGHAQAVYPYIVFPLLKKETWMLGFKAGGGIGLIEKPYDRVTNFKNKAIGTKVNAAINLTPEARFFYNKKISFTTGLSLTHFSNGAFKTPNLGINITTVNTSVSYRFGNKLSLPPRDSVTAPLQKKTEFYMIGAIGFKENSPPGGAKYAAYTLSASAAKAISHKRRISAGLDLFYDSSLREQFGRDSIFNVPASHLSRAGLNVGYELVVGNLSFPVQSGIYLATKYKEDGLIYSRIGLRYAIREHIIINLTLKTHFGVADYIESGIGYKF